MDGEFSLAQPQLHVLGVSDHARLLSPDVFLFVKMCRILVNEQEEVNV